MFHRTRSLFRGWWLIPIVPVLLAILIGLGPAAPVHAAAGPGGKIAFTSDRSGNNDIWVMDPDGSSPTQLTTDGGDDLWPIWSPDGLQIAFISTRSGNSDIWVMNADGSNQTQLTTDAGSDRVPTWSPDGSQLAFWSNRSGNNDIWTMDADGGNQTQLTTDTASDVSPDWSPKGDRITYFSFRDGHAEIYAIDPDGTDETRLTFSPVGFESANGVYSPDGSRIAFATTSTSAPFNGNLFVMNADGSNVTQVTTFSAPDDAGLPQWSANGMKIIYTGYPDGGGLNDIYRINADGSGPIENLTALDTADDVYADQQPPVGGKIAFTSDRAGNQDIWLMNGDGTDPVQLTTDLENDRWPIWSPDGTKIAFHSNRDGVYDIWVMNADGSGQTNLTNGDEGYVATWSPDGSQIAFASDRSGNPDIWIMDADGSNPTQLTTDTGDDVTPDWSPDGTKIVFMSFRDGHAEVYIIDVDGSNETRLTTSAGSYESANPVFSPDGQRIAFIVNVIAGPPYEGNIHTMNVDGSGVTQITSFSDPDDAYVPQWSTDGKKIFYTKSPDGGGFEDVYAINADGSGVPVNITNLDTAYDFFGDQQPLVDTFVSTTTAGSVDGFSFGPHDILKWDGAEWSKAFDGTAAGLIPEGKWKHNINAFYIDGSGDIDDEDVVMSFTQNARFVPGIVPKVDGMDLVKWDGSAFTLWFDGSDVGLTNKTQEKIDALHILDGDLSPVGGSCIAYLLVSTQGPGKVKNPGEPSIRFGGEDVLGFCLTNAGNATAGFWHMVLDGSAEGMPRNATDSLSANVAGNVLWLTTKGSFNVDSAAGGHSMVYQYTMGTGEFSGPVFSAPAEGLLETVDGLQME